MYTFSIFGIHKTYACVVTIGFFEFSIFFTSSKTGNGSGHPVCPSDLCYSKALALDGGSFGFQYKRMYLSFKGLSYKKDVKFDWRAVVPFALHEKSQGGRRSLL